MHVFLRYEPIKVIEYSWDSDHAHKVCCFISGVLTICQIVLVNVSIPVSYEPAINPLSATSSNEQ